MAQVPFVPTDEQRDNVELLAAVGTKHEHIAMMIINAANGKPISSKTLQRHFKNELELGLTKANAIVGQTLFKMASSGQEPGMTAFWMKTRAGFRETNVQQNQNLDRDGNAADPTPAWCVFPSGGPGVARPSGADADIDTANEIESSDATGTKIS